ncbi:MAG TPA: ABC transporter permease [Aggregatilineales bacterium]|nr:ABC transporter permease [Aggregatilineales bacterium]
MRNIWSIFKRELIQYFTSPIAYLVAFAVLLLLGILFNNDLATRNGSQATDGAYILNYFVIAMIFFAPLLTMRLLAEENREGTIELLMTLPVQDSEIVIGKFLGAWAYVTALLLLTVIHQVLLFAISQPDVGQVMSAYAGAWLCSGAAIAVGMLFSAITENQIVAAFLATTCLLMLWVSDLVGKVINNRSIAELVRQFSFGSHYLYSFANGLVRLGDAVFYLGVITVMLYITTQVVASRRWR